MKPEYIIGGIILLLLLLGISVLFIPKQSPLPALSVLQGGDENTGNSNSSSYKEIVRPAGFVNTEGVTLKELVGKKVVLVDFLTYSCINCQRTFPYLNAWYEKYKDQGLEIIGIHTPEFAFEKNIANVREAMKRFGIVHPIVLDNEYATWRAYGNQYWPRKYLIDIHGNIVYDHIGEGDYEIIESKIQELLKERASVLGETSSVGGLVSTAVPVTVSKAQSPETYFGASRNNYLGNGLSGRLGMVTYTTPSEIKPNTLYLGGAWNMTSENAESVSEVEVTYVFNAKEVYLVASAETESVIEVYQDGILISKKTGDVGSDGRLLVKESRLYTVIKNDSGGVHTLKLKIKAKGVQLYAFTFG
ncbi:redoxin domain-containing protein [Patescibacteria group bacterium]|nr:MAG: redoxin domain-containing protein [Patescibacteria group bacterium]